MGKHTLEELYQWQQLPLNVKVSMTRERIRGWVNEYGEEGVYVAFSGGKDSTVLLDIVRNQCGYKNVPAVFSDTGLEYPEIREFVKTFENVTWVKPKYTFKQVIQKYGYPFISKKVCDSLKEAQPSVKKLDINSIDELKKADINILNERLAMLSGRYNEWYTNRNGKSASKDGKEIRSQSKYAFMIFGKYRFSSDCCDAMKKNPMHKYAKETGRYPMTGEQASESLQRTQVWMRNGCNAYDLKEPKSTPMAFWTEQDVLSYIKLHNLPICSIYGDIVEDYESIGHLYGQMNLNDYTNCGLIDIPTPPLKTTGCSRTGCMFCGFGCHLEEKGKGRFELMKQTHPKQYDYIMRPEEQGGLNYKEIIDWLNENGNLDIRY